MSKWGVAALAAVMTMTASAQAQAAACLTGEALNGAKLRQLDVMFLVSSLRCRTGADDFRVEYDGFLTRNRAELGVANRAILAQLTPTLGVRGATDALDRMSVSLANLYGQNSATASCAELKREAASLARPHGAGVLLAAAERLIGEDAEASTCSVRLAGR